jgi:NAD(P)-dependent dehydrogenase (short-subunit alcohol dehydrogenase family)
MNERVALVTGGGRRIGAVLAEAAVRQGYSLIIHYRSSADEANALADRLLGEGVRAATVQADLARGEERDSLIEKSLRVFGRLDLLVNNASMFEYDDVSTLSEANFLEHQVVNVLAPLCLARDFAAALPGDRHGIIVNLLDHKVARPNTDFLSYTASRLALAGLTTALAVSLAPRIRVCGLAPGLTLPSAGWPSADFSAGAAATPLKRSTTPDDLAAALEFILICESITGQIITVDGGASLMQRARDLEFEAAQPQSTQAQSSSRTEPADE